uniref:DUF4258 domain-containing protein n=1 Tax=Ascaris lumbricoides TaxID=6252 RepID=A0A0M3I2X6_ASCLU
MDLIRPTPPAAVRRNDKMEADFNRRHGVRDRSFTRGDLVLIRNYLFQKTSEMDEWSGVNRHGRVTYDVLVGSEIRTRHADGAPNRKTLQQMQCSSRYRTISMPGESHQPSNSQQWTSQSYSDGHNYNRTSTTNTQLRLR